MDHRIHLSQDQKFRQVLAEQDMIELEKRKHVHLQLCSSIISQQLSTKVAAIIYNRFLELFDKKNPSPADILDIPYDTLKSIGLSNSKTHYVRNVCEFFIEEKLTDAKLHKMTSEEIMEKLVVIKGVGKWTVEMILMFTLGYEDVFAVDDLGIQQGMTRLYGLDPTDKKKNEGRHDTTKRKVESISHICLSLLVEME